MNCEHKRTAHVTGKCSDRCFVTAGDQEHDGYVPDDMGIGGGDYLEFGYCLDCGKIQGSFPLPLTQLETPDE